MDDSDGIQRVRHAYGPQPYSAAESLRSKQAKDRDPSAAKPLDETKRDEVSISQLGQELQKVRKAVEYRPALREEKIAELRRLIASGQYQVSDEDLAEKIVQHFLGNG